MAHGAAIFIQRENKILGIHRRNNSNDWGIICGKIEPGETEMQAAIREAKEEAGINIFNLKEIFRSTYRPGVEREIVCFSCDYDGEPSNQPGEPETKWCSVEELTSGSFKEYNEALFRTIGLIK